MRGKGGKDRNLPLTRSPAAAIETYLAESRPRLLSVVRTGSGIYPPKAPKRLFVSPRGGVLYRATLDKTRAPLGAPGWRQEARDATHFSPQRSNPPAQVRCRHPPHPGAPRPSEPHHDRALHPCRDLGPAGGREACTPTRPLTSAPSSPSRRGVRILRYSAASLEKARFELPRLVRHLEHAGVRAACAVTEQHLAAYARHLEQQRTRRGTPLPCKPRLGPEHDPLLLRFLTSRGHLRDDPARPSHFRGARGFRAGSSASARPAGSSQRLLAEPRSASAIAPSSNPLWHRYPARRSGARRRLGPRSCAKACCSYEAARARKIASCPSRPRRPRPRDLPRRCPPRAPEGRGPSAFHLSPWPPLEPRRAARRGAAARPSDRNPVPPTRSPHLRDPSPARRRRHPSHPGTPRPPLPHDDGPLHESRQRGPPQVFARAHPRR